MVGARRKYGDSEYVIMSAAVIGAPSCAWVIYEIKCQRLSPLSHIWFIAGPSGSGRAPVKPRPGVSDIRPVSREHPFAAGGGAGLAVSLES